MAQNNNRDEEKMRIHLMYIEENRVQSFKDWVFDRCECTPKKVSTADAQDTVEWP